MSHVSVRAKNLENKRKGSDFSRCFTIDRIIMYKSNTSELHLHYVKHFTSPLHKVSQPHAIFRETKVDLKINVIVQTGDFFLTLANDTGTSNSVLKKTARH